MLNVTEKFKGAPVIPKIVHRIWFGAGDIPALYDVYWAAWQRQLPDFEFRTWRAADIPGLRTQALIGRAEGNARKVHIACFDILSAHGGIYLDCGVAPYQRFDAALLHQPLVVCSEIAVDSYCSMDFIAAAPATPALVWALDALSEKPLNRLPPNVETGPCFFREALKHGAFFELPAAAFYPYSLNEPMAAIYARDLAATYGIRVWEGAALNERQLRTKVDEYLTRGDLKATVELIAGAGKSGLGPVVEFCNLARSARQGALDAAKHNAVSHRLKVDDARPLEFAKVSSFVVTQIPDLLMWQIGAADGVLADPLRTLLVSFDAPAVLVEPNPYLFAMLADNYRNNTQLKLVNAALQENTGKLVLHAVKPAAVRAKGLPDWVLGMSSAFTDRHTLGVLASDAAATRAAAECFEMLEVDAIDVDHLLALNPGAHPGIIVVDAEGADFAIVMQILAHDIRPFILQFQTASLPSLEVQALTNALEKEYVLQPFGDDMVAYRTDLFVLYCDNLYVEHGIPTIYQDALKLALNI